MSLQVCRTGSTEYGQFIKALIVGPPGSGKTRHASTWKNPLFASAEGGLMSIADRNTPFVNIKRSEDLLQLKILLDQDPEIRENTLGFPVDTIVIDTIDEVQKILIKERITAGHKDSMELRDWGWLGDQMQGILRGYRNLDMNVVVTCHTKDESDSETGRLFKSPGLQGAISSQIAGFFDLSLLLKAQPKTVIKEDQAVKVMSRFFQTFPDQQHDWIKDRSGQLPPEFEINFDDDYDRLYELIYAKNDLVTNVPDLVGVPEADNVDPMSGEELPPVVPATVSPAAVKVTTQVAEAESTVIAEADKPKDASPMQANPEKAKARGAKAKAVPVKDAGEEAPTGMVKNDDCPKGQDLCAIDQNQADLSRIRFRKTLCRECFVNERKK